MATEDLKPISRTTGLGSGVGVIDFHKSMNDFASSANTLGQIGSEMSQKASNAFSEHMGYEAGKNPNGNPLPAFTKSDEAYNKTYKAGAHASVGLQLSGLLSDAQIDFSKIPNPTPEDLEVFNKNLAKGSEALLKLAPDGVRQPLELSFNSSLLQINGSINTKMMLHQKTAEHDKQISMANSSNIDIYNTSVAGNQGGNDESAITILEDRVKLNQDNFIAGNFTQKERDSSNAQAEISYKKGKYIGLYNKSLSQGNENQFLNDFDRNIQADLTPTQKKDVQSALITQVKSDRYLRAGESQAILNAYKLKPVWTASDIETLKTQVSESQFYKAMYDYNVRQTKRSIASDKADYTNANWGNVDTWGNISNDQRTAGLAVQVENLKKLDKDPDTGEQLHSDSEYERAAVKSAGGEIPSYSAKIEGQLLNGNGVQMTEAVKAYEDIGAAHPNKLKLSKKALATMVVFSDRNKNLGNADEAADQATKIVSHKTKEQIEQSASLVSDFNRDNFKDTNHVIDYSTNLAGVSKSALISPFDFGYYVKNIVDENIALVHDKTQGETLAKIEIAKIFGYSNVNGKRQFVQFPVERIVNMPETKNSASIINADLAAQIKVQIAETNRLFNEKDEKGQRKSPFYFKVVKEPNLEAALLASNFVNGINDNDLSGQEYLDALTDGDKAIKDFNNSGQVELQQIDSNGNIESHKLSVRAGMLMTQSGDPGKIVAHGYQVLSTNDSGGTAPIGGSNFATINGFTYTPNQSVLGAVFFAMNKHPESEGNTIQDRFNKLLKQTELENRILSDIGRSRFRLSFDKQPAPPKEQQPVVPEPEPPVQLESEIPPIPELKNKEKDEPISEEGHPDLSERPESFFEQMAKIESSDKGMSARSKTGAIGKYQFLQSTWNDLVKKHGKEFDMTKKDIFDLNSQEIFARAYAKDNEKVLIKKLGREPKDFEIYMAHNIGATGTARLILHAQNSPDAIVTTKGIGSNPAKNPLFFMSNKGKIITYKKALARYEKAFKGAK
ncbi:MAG: hypothetical protein QNK36_10495 [Colwellia sp.]|nr:hypothetical protein [Colwellia sp.]